MVKFIVTKHNSKYVASPGTTKANNEFKAWLKKRGKWFKEVTKKGLNKYTKRTVKKYYGGKTNKKYRF